MDLQKCSHGKNLLAKPHEHCEKCAELWDLEIMKIDLTSLLRLVEKRRTTLFGKVDTE